ncbi:MAG: excisionase [Lachnospiraceae bacterium]|nr:excisionase [Lachnospiraceae bacterium]
MNEEMEYSQECKNIPVWKRYLLTIVEAAQYYHIGEKRLRQIVDMHPNGDFYLQIGNRILIKKEQFEQFLTESTVI